MSATIKWDRRPYRSPSDFGKRSLPYFLLRRLRWTLGNRSPFFAYVKLTRRCNLDCAYCPWHTGTVNSDPELSSNQWKDIFSDLANRGIRVLVLEGGEPTLRSDLPQLLDHAHSLGLTTVVGTNGTTNPWRIRPTAFTVSVDGPMRIHDSVRGSGNFDRLLANLEQNPGIPVASITVLNRGNYRLIEETLDAVMPLVTVAGFTFQYPYSARDELLLTPQEVRVARQTLLRLKKSRRFRILNANVSLRRDTWTCYPEIAVSVSHLGEISSHCFVGQIETPDCKSCQLGCYRLLSALHSFNFEAWFNLYRHLLRHL